MSTRAAERLRIVDGEILNEHASGLDEEHAVAGGEDLIAVAVDRDPWPTPGRGVGADHRQRLGQRNGAGEDVDGIGTEVDRAVTGKVVGGLENRLAQLGFGTDIDYGRL